MCLFQNGGVLNLGQDFSKDSRFQWTPIQEDVWYTGTSAVALIALVVTVSVHWGLAVCRQIIGHFGDWSQLEWGILDFDSSASPSHIKVIVDSGTTLLIVDQQIMSAIQTLFYSYCSSIKLPGVCGLPVNASYDVTLSFGFHFADFEAF
jgi:hypothetical protein